MKTFYYVSSTIIDKGQTVKPYGRGHNFGAMFNFCASLVKKNSDKIPFIFVIDDYINAKGIACTNPYSLGSMLREVLAEQIRYDYFADKPPRVGSVFLFKNYMDAYHFLLDYRKANGWIYRCESIAHKVFTGDMAIITHARLASNENPPSFQTFKDSMINYWRGNEPMEYPETICHDPVTIIEPAFLAYQYDATSGRFISSLHIPLDCTSGQPILPDACTLKAPVFTPGKNPVYKNGNWISE